MVLWRGRGEGGSFFLINLILLNRYIYVSMYMYIYLYLCVYMCVYIYIYIYLIYIYTCVCVYVCMCMYMCIYIYIYICMYMFITPVFVDVYMMSIFECIERARILFWSYDHVHIEKEKNVRKKKELNWLCKHMKNVRSCQPCTSMNFFSKA